jgi:hypothetical protein
VLLAPSENSDGMLVDFAPILVLREVESAEGAAATTALCLGQSSLSGDQPSVFLLNNCVEVIYLSNRVFFSILSFGRVLAACDGDNVEHGFVGVILLEGRDVDEAVRGDVGIKVLKGLADYLFTLHGVEVLHGVSLWRLLITWEEPQDLDVDLANVAGSVGKTDDLNWALADQLLYLQVLYHPGVQIVDQVELEALQARLLERVLVPSVKDSEDGIRVMRCCLAGLNRYHLLAGEPLLLDPLEQVLAHLVEAA